MADRTSPVKKATARAPMAVADMSNPAPVDKHQSMIDHMHNVLHTLRSGMSNFNNVEIPELEPHMKVFRKKVSNLFGAYKDQGLGPKKEKK